MRAALVIAGSVAALVAMPGVAAADVIFDPADAQDLAAVLTEATEEQKVCYGWQVQVDDAVAGRSESVGSNFGAGTALDDAQASSCRAKVVFNAYITYTSESSESEDSASYDIVSTPTGPTRADLDALDIDLGGLTGDNADVVVGKAVSALPLLAADSGLAKPIEATPAPASAAADAQLTDNPGSDWWRANGGAVLWSVGLLLGGGIFALYALKTSRRAQRGRPLRPTGGQHEAITVPDTVPEEFLGRGPVQQQRPVPGSPNPTPGSHPQPQPAPKPEGPTSDTSEKDPGTGGQKDKE